MSTAATPTAPFTQCPAIGADTSCALLINITDSGATVLSDSTQGPYDSVEDTLIGVVNNSSQTLGALGLTSSTDLFGFDGDGLCTYSGAGCPFGPTGYEGPNTAFSDIAANASGGVVNFPAGIAPGSTAYFSLEESLSTSNVSTGSGQSAVAVYEQGQASNPRENQTTCNTTQPVNCATGTFWHTFSDLTVPGRGPTLALSRTYSSLMAGQDSPFGFGWTDPYTMSVTTDSSGNATIHQENGSTITFANSSGTYVAPTRVQASLVRNSDGTWTLTDFHGGGIHTFSSAGALVGLSDRNGYSTTLIYSGTQLTKVTDPAGRTLTFAYNTAGRVQSVTDSTNRSVSYGYDTSGNLTSATDVNGGTSQFSYGAGHLMTSMTNPRNGTVTNVYDSNGRVTKQTDPMGRVTQFAYSGDPTTTAGSTSTITDPRGIITTEVYQQMQLLSVTHAAGTSQAATTTFSYDPFTLGLASRTDPNGHTTTFAWDRSSDLLSQTDPLGRKRSTSWTTLNEPATVTDATGVTTTLSYDTRGNLTQVSRPLTSTGQNSVTQFTYGDAAHPGDITAAVDPNGNTTTYSYTANGDLASATDPLGEKTTYGYDGIGRRTSMVSPRGNATGANPASFTTSYAYSPFGDVTSETDPLGHVTKHGYDSDRNVTSVTDSRGNVTTTTFDLDNEPTAVAQANGITVGTGYDVDGNVVSQTDGAGKVTVYTYDSLNHRSTSADALNRKTTYVYDSVGNLTTLTDSTGRVTTSGYDAANEQTSTHYSDGSTPNASYAYTALGQLQSMTDGTGTTTRTYDSLGHLTATKDGAGHNVGYGYDLAGHNTSITYPNGKTVTRSYDASGRLNGVTDWNGKNTSIAYTPDSQTGTTTYGNGVAAANVYDNAGGLTSTTDTLSGTTIGAFQYARDALEQVTSATTTGAGSQPTQSYGYTPLNQLGGINSTSVTYDNAGNITGNGAGSTYAYDAANEVTSVTTGSLTTPMAYDGNGNRQTTAGPAGYVVGLSYDQANRVTGAERPGAGGTIADGGTHSLVLKSDGTVWAWGYNGFGQLGNGTTTDSKSTPVQVTGLPSMNYVAASGLNSAAVGTDGTVWTWGSNSFGELAIGSTSPAYATTPQHVAGLGNVKTIALASGAMAALKSDGTVWTWGDGSYGQLGNGFTKSSSTPAQVKGLSGVTAIASGDVTLYALKADGTVWAWGGGSYGQLGNGTSSYSAAKPVQVTGLSGVTAIGAAYDTAYAVLADGGVRSWGDNNYGQLGNGTTGAGSNPLPVAVTGLTGVVSITGGQYHTLALKSDGSTWAWGTNYYGELGMPLGSPGSSIPVKITTLPFVGSVDAGGNDSLVALPDGTVRTFGTTEYTGPTYTTPTPVAGLTGVGPGAGGFEAAYTYSADGLRETSTGVAYTWQTNTTMPVVLSDGTLSYVYDDGGLPIEQIDGSGTTLYYQHDQYGSTRLLTNSSGAAAATYTYSPFGQLASHTGTELEMRWCETE